MMARSPSGGTINISATTKKIDVDNRISLLFYYRIADNILKQADIFREEKNIIDLYVMLLRFSSLVTETIPCHRDYRTSPQGNKVYLKRKLITAVTELEELKPAVKAKLQELHNKQIHQLNKQQNSWQNDALGSSVEWPAFKENWNGYSTKKGLQPVTSKYGYQPRTTLLTKPVEAHLQRISLSIPRPKEETLSKHSILGPNGLRAQWQPPSNHKVQYPSTVDFSPLQVPRDSNIQQSINHVTMMRDDDCSSEVERSSLEPAVQPKNDNQLIQEPDALISFEPVESSSETEIIRQPSPPPVLADVQDLIPTSAPATQTECRLENASSDALVCSEDPLQLHVSTELMNTFMKLAKANTDKNLETCGVLAGSLRNRKFYITALIIPKQEATSDSCQTTNEEEIFDVQDKQSLFPLGWIHTHPTQSCFMSSIDVHTHYSYQIMLPEAIAIVMAPRDCSRTHGIFRLTSGGMTVIRQCPRRGFHAHEPPSDGSPIYRCCTDVYMNPSLKFDVIDLR
ncbi:SMAD6 interacting protein AMSH, contains JAB/MPN/Mov34 domain [Handroanthus impetiginosus]|uniref:SMAD6 interacting protein AMSH, contains JAB/MPN/Mov34 domain n=1 Tax=Handroanthus impetiginosus TaxID=429701 RepID=A0A2G9FZG1_9LAMI|nr:SMAD6 interacting protein AMSH, contains JAB/MPN/Mov34 domain [Handroanthus impetiginosus]